jgi:hypothetical protein
MIGKRGKAQIVRIRIYRILKFSEFCLFFNSENSDSDKKEQDVALAIEMDTGIVAKARAV